MFRPLLTYAAPSWCNRSDTQYKRLQTVQSKLLRLSTKSDRYTNMNELHRHFDIPKSKDLLTQISTKFYTHDYLTATITNNIKDIPDGLRRTHKYL